MLGASLIAAIVASFAFAWGVGEIAGLRRSLEFRPLEAGWFYGVYGLRGWRRRPCLAGPDLVALNVAAQVLNVFLLPLVIGFLVLWL